MDPSGKQPLAPGRSEGPANQLTEPVSDTIVTPTQKRDLNRVYSKLKYVLLPRADESNRNREVRDWDLWGPLFMCLLLSVTLSLSSKGSSAGTVFALVFVIVWVGAGIVTVNSKLLGGKMSFFQSVCLLGYCIFPMNIAAIGCWIFSGIFELVIVGVCLVWSLLSSMRFITELVSEDKKLIAEYPVLLFFVFLGWLIIIVE